MKHIIFDCDSTAGLPGKPMDDALALLYLLGRPEEVGILGITCTFANGTAAEVYGATRDLLHRIRREEIPLLPGAEAGEDPRSDAARFIADTVCARPGEVTFVGIGSLTNLYGACLLEPTVPEKLAGIVLMGGYTAPVRYHGRHLEELNFSVNPRAAAWVLNRCQNITVLTGNNTLEPSYLPQGEFMDRLLGAGPGGRFIAGLCGYRFRDKEARNGEAASYCWDAVATVYLLHPELFRDQITDCFLTERTMHSGWLGVTDPAPDTRKLNLPAVADPVRYREEMYGGWLNFTLGEETP